MLYVVLWILLSAKSCMIAKLITEVQKGEMGPIEHVIVFVAWPIMWPILIGVGVWKWWKDDR